MKKNINITQYSLNIVKNLSKEINTFHHHYHILYDIANEFSKKINYVEIGCYCGGSSCLMLQQKNIKVTAIDLGIPIPKEIVLKHVSKYNINNSIFNYIEGNSQTIETINKLKTILNGDGIDILFIDGGHTYMDVINDFNLYCELVNENGYIIFDDYNDHIYSPEVKLGVDKIVSDLIGYDIIGTIKNDLGAFPSDLIDGNCFIIKKNNNK